MPICNHCDAVLLHLNMTASEWTQIVPASADYRFSVTKTLLQGVEEDNVKVVDGGRWSGTKIHVPSMHSGHG